MSRPVQPATIGIQQLVGREVRDTGGKRLGHVSDVIAEADGDELVVTGLLVGGGSWLTRFGWTMREHGRVIPWEAIIELSPHIVARAEGERRS
jgi:sporulation protein YlmC with PRC-barrel domain